MVEARMKSFALAVALLLSVPAFAQEGTFFTPGNLVVTVEGCGVHGGTCTNVPNGTGNGSGNSSVGGFGDNQGSSAHAVPVHPKRNCQRLLCEFAGIAAHRCGCECSPRR